MSGQFAAFTWFCALHDLDLKFVRIDEVVTGDAKATGSDLLDGGAAKVAVGITCEALGIFAAFTGVLLTAESIHSDRKSLMSFFTDRTV